MNYLVVRSAPEDEEQVLVRELIDPLPTTAPSRPASRDELLAVAKATGVASLIYDEAEARRLASWMGIPKIPVRNGPLPRLQPGDCLFIAEPRGGEVFTLRLHVAGQVGA